MKYLVSLIVIILTIFCTITLRADNKIVYLDMNKIMNESKAGKSISNRLEKIHKINIKEFKKIEEELKKEEELILSQKNILSKSEYSKKINQLRIRAKEYRESRKKRIDSLTKKRIEATAKLIEKVNPILYDYSTKNGISIILPKKNVILGKTELDITNKIIESINSEITEIGLN